MTISNNGSGAEASSPLGSVSAGGSARHPFPCRLPLAGGNLFSGSLKTFFRHALTGSFYETPACLCPVFPCPCRRRTAARVLYILPRLGCRLRQHRHLPHRRLSGRWRNRTSRIRIVHTQGGRQCAGDRANRRRPRFHRQRARFEAGSQKRTAAQRQSAGYHPF